MKNCIYKVFIFLFFPLLTNCSGSDEPEVPPSLGAKAKLSISTSIQTKAVVTTFKANDRMNLFVKTSASAGSSDYKSGVSAMYDGSTWSIIPEVELQSEAYIFAAYPYSSSADAENMTVSVFPQTDYLYSGSGIKVSGNAPKAVLTMKHALPMIAFNIAKVNYIGEGKLSAVKVSGEGLYRTGSMNVANGQIVGKDKGDYTVNVTQTIENEGWTENFPQAFCLPFNSNGNNIMVTFTIDGKEFQTVLPKQNVIGGMKYLFRLVLAQDEIIALTDKTEVLSLNIDIDEMPSTNINELSILYKGKKAVLPEVKGNDIVSGTVHWGDGTQEAYQFPLSYIYKQEGEYQVKLQSFGANWATFTDLELVEEIDFSSF